MKLHTAVVSLLALTAIILAGVVVALFGLDRSMVAGLALGLVCGAGLTLLGGRSLARALGHGSKSALLLHIYGGFLFRLLLLVAGFVALVATGWASPVGFVVAFLVGVVLALLRQVSVFGSEAGDQRTEVGAQA